MPLRIAIVLQIEYRFFSSRVSSGKMIGWKPRRIRTKFISSRAVYIHPFYNGNGRTARLLMNFVLMRRGFQPIILPEETRDEKKRYSIWRTIAIRKGIGMPKPFF
ncbi:hypothetical protein niasHT_000143 [Heterodera trifolii]|uniref:Fido domain-containing protein n=1 Tax=Heterodera trifolii TaxID=157864 RepID=A0ABD2M583_9BILA